MCKIVIPTEAIVILSGVEGYDEANYYFILRLRSG